MGLAAAAIGWFLVDLHSRDTTLFHTMQRHTSDIAELKRADVSHSAEINRLRILMDKRNDN